MTPVSEINSSKRQQARRSLARDLRLALTWLMVACILITGSALLVDGYLSQYRLLQEAIGLRAKHTAHVLERYLSRIEDELRSFSSHTGLAALPHDLALGLIKAASDRNQAFRALILLDGDGRVIARHTRHEVVAPQDWSSQDAFLVPRKNHVPFTSKVSVDPGSHLPTLTRSVPLRDSDGQVAGVLIARINLAYFIRLLQTLDTGDHTYVIDTYQDIVAINDASMQLAGALPPSLRDDLERKTVSELKEPRVYQGLEDRKVIGTFVPLDELGWSLVNELPYRETYAPLIGKAILIIVLLLVAAVVTAMVFTRLAARKLFMPLEHLTRAIQAYAPGATPFRVDLELHHEIDVLAKAFEELTSRLHSAITSLNASQAELLAARGRAESAMHAKSEFLAVMSHEIRTPLNGVIGMSRFLMDTPLSQEQREFAQVIRESSEHLLVLINDILDFSRLEAGKMPEELQTFGLRELIEQTLEMIDDKAEAKGLDLAYAIAGDLPELVQGDPSHLRQVLLNLLSNAVKFTVAGAIKVQVERADGDDDSHGLEIKFLVSDTGIGIPAEKLPTLFKPFVQADSSHARLYGGTGLGLAISHKLVTLAHGRIGAEPNAAGGTDFHFTMRFFPAKTQQVERPGKRPVSPLERSRILLITGNEVRARHVASLARSRHIIVDTVAGTETGSRGPSAGPGIGAVIIDVMSEHFKDAIEQGRKIRAQLANPQTPLIFVAPRRLKAEWSKSFPLPACHFLSKIIKRSAFEAIFDQLAESQHPVTPARPAKPPSRPDKAPASTLKILLVEDNAVNQMVTTMQLRSLGYRADIAGNGQEALEAVERNTYDLILMDIQMPVMDGLEATSRIRRNPTLRSQPRIVALTAMASHEDRDLCLAAGMDDFISKPVSLESLEETLAKITDARGHDAEARSPSGPRGARPLNAQDTHP